ncbi:YbfB/YjiJ family MFS transporter [Piscinibacter terrae]|uniref:YbfB/YjiJ family MFS transporter n=1 Tax=Piscinibacter terrae TaxID=2496871 RepID=A0A3N7K3I8_9BURK|nr:YbfB/YjiJ family MFS transporter [Albitalea terrae]RQP25505.1 YbfB/YjiJ family MFS transporter [Albitalea terrae]
MTSQERPIAPATLALAGALSLAAAMGIGRFAFTPVLPLMLSDGMLDVAQAGWMAAANYAGYLAGALSAARLPLRAGTMAVLALLATSILTVAMAWPLPAIWLPLRFLAGAASAWVFVSTSVWCLGALAQQGAGSASGWVYAGVGGGIALAGLHCLLAAAAGVRSAPLWLQLGGLALLLGLPAFRAIASLPPRADAAPAPAVADGSDAEAFGTRGLVVCYGMMGFGYILPATFLPMLARTAVDDPRVFGLAWPIFGCTAALSTLFAARLLRDATRLKTWAACQLLMGLGVLLPALRVNLWTIAMSALLVGGTFMVITLAGVQEMRARAHGHVARLVGRMTAAFALGQIAGPIVSAPLLRTGPQGLSIALAAGAAGLLATGAWLWRTACEQPPLEMTRHG